MKHNIETANKSLKAKALDGFLTVLSINFEQQTVLVNDSLYGDYVVEIKALSPLTSFPLHKLRRFKKRIDNVRNKYVGQVINGIKIMGLFYGPEKGYKNKSFYLECKGTCGHIFIDTYASLTKHRKNFICSVCSSTDHGERGKVDGKLKKRTSTYNYWVGHKDILPKKYWDFSVFRDEAGEKPYKRAEIQIIDNKLFWKNLQVVEDHELNLIASAIRQAFRHSQIYKNALESARVETEKGSFYLCKMCGNLNKRKDIQVDHIEPIMSLDGTPLKKETLLDRIWTDKVQILDKKCHTKKTNAENKIRKESKK